MREHLPGLSSKDVVMQTDRVRVNCVKAKDKVSDSGGANTADVLGSHEFKTGIEELLSSIIIFSVFYFLETV